MKNFLNLLIIFFLTASCTMAPRYKTPASDIPFAAENATKKKPSQISWQEYYTSPNLQKVIELALTNNKDMQIANVNIEAVRQTYNVARANLLPTINATAFQTRQGVPSAFASFTPRQQFRANISITAYELDFFGRLQSLKKSAYESYLASEQARRVLKIALISEVVNSYAQLALDREVLAIANDNLKAQEKRYDLAKKRFEAGTDSNDQLLFIEDLLESLRIIQENYTKIVAQDENALMLLCGKFDDQDLLKNISLNDVVINQDLLDLAPSTYLLSRPDIVQAEHELKSANANIGAARAAFFPSITITASNGYASRELNNLINSKVWTFTPQINLPIFTGGRNIANLKLANLQKKIEIMNYEKSIQIAFRESLDALAEKKAVDAQLKSYENTLRIRQKTYENAKLKEKIGSLSAIDIVDVELSYLQAKQNALTAKKANLMNLITLYKVMGGGSEM